MQVVVEARNLTKRYANATAVDHVHFSVQKGECFGFLGANGAGKSTLMKMIYGSCLASEGELFVLEMKAKDHMMKIKARIGVVPQENGLDSDLSVLDNLQTFAHYHGLNNKRAQIVINELLKQFNLDSQAHDTIDSLSGGMKRRLTIARALIAEPDLLIFDEPTTGLDPQERYRLWNLVDELKAKGKTILLTTHDMEEAEELCDRLLIMEKGKILCQGTPQELIQRMVGREVVEFYSNANDIEYHVNRFKAEYDYQIINNTIRLYLPKLQDGKEVLNMISSDRVQVRRANLNDVFLKLAGYEIQD